jgi:hypothetical protein
VTSYAASERYEFLPISGEFQPLRHPGRPRFVAAGVADEKIERLIDHDRGTPTTAGFMI